MGSQIEPNGDFVEQWLAARKAESELDQSILSLIDKHREGSGLDEAGLLGSLTAPPSEPEDKNGPD